MDIRNLKAHNVTGAMNYRTSGLEHANRHSNHRIYIVNLVKVFQEARV